MPLPGQKITENVWPGIPAAPISTSSNGTPTAGGGSETFDAILGFYQATLINGHRYEVKMNGLIGNCGANGDEYQLQIRDSGNASNPTTGSTLVAQTQWSSTTNGISSRTPIYIANTFVAGGSGVHTFGFSSARISGTGVFTPVNGPNLFRELFVVDLGGN